MINKKVLIFGAGKILDRWISRVNLDSVIAFTDNNPKVQHGKIYGKLIIPPERIHFYKYDYIVIFTVNYAKQIYKQLTEELGIEDSKIISWQYFIHCDTYNRRYLDYDSIIRASQLLIDMGIKDIIDVHMAFERFCIYSKRFSGFINLNTMRIDGFRFDDKPLMPIFYNIYDNIYTDWDICNNRYDAVFMIDLFIDHTIEECSYYIEKTYQLSKYIIITIPYRYPRHNTEWFDFNFAKYGDIQIIQTDTYQILVIDKMKNIIHEDIKIFIATHKSFHPPVNKIYVPIHAGKKGKESLGYEGDDTGDNISELNPMINESTALYWIWKHATENYIGLNHYRRYLLRNSIWQNMQNILDEETVRIILKDYDIILANAMHTYPYSVSEHLKLSVSEDAYQAGIQIVEEIIKEKHPDYLEAYYRLFGGFAFYPCNIFITSKEILDQYCEWLFDIILDACQRISTEGYDNYSSRIIGFLAERLLSVWVINNKLRIKELPILVMSNTVE